MVVDKDLQLIVLAVDGCQCSLWWVEGKRDRRYLFASAGGWEGCPFASTQGTYIIAGFDDKHKDVHHGDDEERAQRVDIDLAKNLERR